MSSEDQPEEEIIDQRPIDKGWAWMVALGACVAMIFCVGSIRCLGIILVEIVTRFKVSSTVASLMIGIIAAGMSLVAPFSNVLGEHLGFRYIVIFGGISCCTACFLVSFGENIIYIIIIFGIFTGLGYGCLFGPSLCAVGSYFDKHRALGNGVAVAGGSLGQLVIPLFTRFVIDEFGFSWGLVLYGAIQLNIVPAALLMRTTRYYQVKKHKQPYSTAWLGDVIPNNNQQAEKNKDLTEELQGNPVTDLEISPATNDEDSPMLIDDVSNLKVKYSNGVTKKLMRSATSLNSLKERLHSSVPNLTQALDVRYVSTRSLDIVALEQKPPEFNHINKLNVDSLRGSKTSCNSAVCRNIIKVTLMKNYLFLLYLGGVCFGNAGYINACLYLPPYADDIGVDKRKAAFLLAIVGVTDLVGRIAGGWFSDLGLIKRSNILVICMMVTGSTTIVCMFFPSYPGMVVLSCVLGIIGGFFVSLLAVVLVDFLGVAVMAEAMGLSMMFQGLFGIIITTVLGVSKDTSGGYIVAYTILGSLMILSGTIFAFEPCARRWEERRMELLNTKQGDNS